MATVNFTKPVTSDLRADVLSYIRDAINSQARMFDGDTLVSAPVGTIRYVNAYGGSAFQRWDGSAWQVLYNDVSHASAGYVANYHDTYSYRDGPSWTMLRRKATGPYATGVIGGLYTDDVSVNLFSYDYAVSSAPKAAITLDYNGDITYSASNSGGGERWHYFSTNGGVNRVRIGADSVLYISTNWTTRMSEEGIILNPNASTGGWARGMTVRRGSDWSFIGASGFFGSNEGVSWWRATASGSALTSWWDPTLAVNGLTVSATGNAALSTGSAPAATNPSYRSLDVGALGTSVFGQYGASGMWLTSNCYYDGQWKYARAGHAWRLEFGQASDSLVVYRAPYGSADVAHNAVVLYQIDSAGQLLNGVTDSGTSTAHFRKNGASAYGKAVLVSCTGGTDGPQIWYRRDGISEWGVGMVQGTNDWGGFYGGNHATFGTEVFRFYSGGGFLLPNGTATLIKSAGGSDYTNYNIEVRTSSGDAGIGFHNGGANAGTLLYGRATNRFEFRGNPVSGWAGVAMGSLIGAGSLSSYGTISVLGEKNGWSGLSFYDGSSVFCGTMMFRSSDGYWGIYNKAENNWNLQVDGSGNLTALGNVTAYSDARLKKDVVTIRGALREVKKMRGVRFRKIEDDAPGVGVIAQEIGSVVPEVVHQTADGTLSVAYGNLAGFFIEAIKELSARLDRLEGHHVQSEDS